MKTFTDLDEAALYITKLCLGDLKLATPLGLGKANQLVNKIYAIFKNSAADRQLELYTALSLAPPVYKTNLEKKLLEPFVKRHFGEYPKLQYVEDLRRQKVPENIKIHEFYFQAGLYAGVAEAQQNYISLNYTHAARALADRGLQVIVQIIARGGPARAKPYSLSCNPDMTLDLVDLYSLRKSKIFIVGVVHPDLPYLGGDAAVDESFFDVIVDSPDLKQELFALPRQSIDEVDQMIGLHASQLVEDDGTMQIGIGSLSDALVYSLLQRHQNNLSYQSVIKDFWSIRKKPETLKLSEAPFVLGLYGTSEMLMDGFMHLRRAKILKRFVFDQDELKKRYLHAAFFLGSKVLYEWLRNLSGEDYDGLAMTRVSKVNDLYDPHEMALRKQRKNARFFNTCMQVNLLGGASSDTLENGQVVTGVGGQYNFVSMSAELIDAHSVLMLRSTRTKNGKRYSNIVSSNGQLTIPRHLRDVVVTEYGIAYLRGRTDAEVIQALIEISDAEFHAELISWAVKNQKLPAAYKVPASSQNNRPEMINAFVKKYRSENFFREDPFGSDFDTVEKKLIKSLTALKEKSKAEVLKIIFFGLFKSKKPYSPELERLGLNRVRSLKELFERVLVIAALAHLQNKS